MVQLFRSHFILIAESFLIKSKMLPACALVDPQGLVFLKMFNLFDMCHWYLFGLESLQNLIFADLISLC